MSDSRSERAYSPKEIAIFKAVATLLHAGRKPHEIKVAEIAKAAGIGKGTAYEYFSCKSELIRQAFIYHLQLEGKRLDERLAKFDDFKNAFFDLLTFSLDMIESRMPSLWTMLSTLDPDEVHAILGSGDHRLEGILDGIDEKLDLVMQMGMRQGYLDPDSSRSYRRFVLTGTLSAFIQMVQRSKMQSQFETQSASLTAIEHEIQQFSQDAWLMLRRSLSTHETIGT